ncbi:MAG: HD-GYP domain-containing protein [Planctomycetota bacterium]|nr:HD-GYP domain-containing protein [Planctomycetota bacterium]
MPEIRLAHSADRNTDLFGARCAELGLAAWPVDPQGRLLSELPEGEPALPIPASREVAVAALELHHARGNTTGSFVRRGGVILAWISGVTVKSRRPGPSGWVVALADDAHAPLTLRLLESARRDLSDRAELDEARLAIASFTRELTDSYETTNLLYTLGRAMGDPTRPDHFARLVCDRLRETLNFGWTAAVFVSEAEAPSLPEPLRGACVTSGRSVPAEHTLRGALRLRARAVAGLRTATILEGLPELTSAPGYQLIMRPIFRAEGVVGVMLASDKRGADPMASSYDTQLIEAAGASLDAYLENTCLFAEQRSLFLGTLHALVSSIDAKDPYTRGHSERVAAISERIARALGYPADRAERVRIAGLVHDVGKIGVPESVLCKQGRLTDDEFASIKRHPEIGQRILAGIPLLADVLPGVLHHHERLDGKGYPHRLAGESIPEIARIIAVADTFDAMSSSRSYRAAMPREKVLAELARSAGTQLDPRAVDAFLSLDLTFFDELIAREARAAQPPAVPAQAA